MVAALVRETALELKVTRKKDSRAEGVEGEEETEVASTRWWR